MPRLPVQAIQNLLRKAVSGIASETRPARFDEALEQVLHWSPSLVDVAHELPQRLPKLVDPRIDQIMLTMKATAPPAQTARLAGELGLNEAPTRQGLLDQLQTTHQTGRNLTNYSDKVIERYTPSSYTITPYRHPSQHSMTTFRDASGTRANYAEHNFPNYEQLGKTPKHNNVYLHTRGTTFQPTDELYGDYQRFGTPAFSSERPFRVVDEVQSSWAQDARADVPWQLKLGQLSKPELDRIHDASIGEAKRYTNWVKGNWRIGQRFPYSPEWQQLMDRYAFIPADVREDPNDLGAIIRRFRIMGAEEYNPPSLPMYPKTQTWTKLGLKNELTRAIEGDADKLALWPGRQYAETMQNPKLQGYYETIVPQSFDSVFAGHPISKETSPFSRVLEISPTLRAIHNKYGLPGGGARIWSEPEAKQHLDKLAQSALRELRDAGFPTALALSALAAFGLSSDTSSKESAAQQES
jgi:hypothetical protein